MGWDADCEGALTGSRPIVVFPSRSAARKAIAISRSWRKLQSQRGGSTNEDWSPECAEHIKVVDVVEAVDHD